MRVNAINCQPLQSNAPQKTCPSFGIRIRGAVIEQIFKDDLFQRLNSATSGKAKQDIVVLGKRVLKKAQEIKDWDNPNTILGFWESKNPDKYDFVISMPINEDLKRVVLVPARKIKSLAETFLGITKQSYLEAKKSELVKYAKEYSDEFITKDRMKDFRRELGDDSFEVFKETYLMSKHFQKKKFVNTLSEMLGV